MWQIHTVGTQNYLYFPEQKILLDCGPNRDQARKIKKLVGEVNFLILTHAHADHYGGFFHLAASFPQLVPFVSPSETAFLTLPLLEPALLFGGFPPRSLATPFLLGPENLPFQRIDFCQFPEIELVPLPGHTPGLLGVALGDALFASDALFGLEILKKYPILYHFQPEEALNTLKNIEERFSIFYPSHGKEGRKALIKENKNAIERVFTLITEIVIEGSVSLEQLLQKVMANLSSPQSLDHYYLNRSALLGYVSALERQREITLQLGNLEIIIQKT